MAAVYTTNPLFVIPSAATGVSITPSGSDFGLSGWTEISASTPENWAAVAIAFRPGVVNVFVRLYIGVGSPGNEVITAVADGYVASSLFTFDMPRFVLDIPLPKNIPAGSRVSVAMAKSGTDTTAWTNIKLNYYKRPVLGNAPTTDADMVILSGSNTGNATPFADSAWSVISASTPAEYLLSTIVPVMFNNVYAYVELGIGTPGNEVPITCVKADSINTTALAVGGLYQCKVWPLRRVPAGSRLVGRVRKSGTSTSTFFYSIIAYQANAADYPDIVTERAQTWLPNAAAATLLPAPGVSWGDGAWVTVLAALPDRAVITAIHPQMDTTGGGDDSEFDIGHGAAASEQVGTTHRTTGWGWTTGADRHASFKVGSPIIPSGARLAARVRAQNTSVGYAATVGLIYDPDFEQLGERQRIHPPGAQRISSAAGNATPWASNAWQSFTTFPGDVLFTGMTFAGHGDLSHELEWGIGASPAVLTTFAIQFGGNTGGMRDFPVHGYPILIPSGQAISFRFRKPGTSIGPVSVSMAYVGDFSALPTTTTPEDRTIQYGDHDRNVTLVATVVDGDLIVNEGEVEFTVEGLGSVTALVVNGVATAAFTIPGGTPVGSYTITAVFNGTDDFVGSEGEATLTITEINEDGLCSQEEPILFASIKPPVASRAWYAVTDLDDPDFYYGGWKEDRLLSISDVRRSLSGPALDYQIGTFQVELADEDYAIRAMLVAEPNYSRWETEAYLISPSGRKVFNHAHRIATGKVDSDPEFDTRDQAMTVKFTARDRVGVAMGWTNDGQSKMPRRVLSSTNLPGIVTAMVGKGAWIPWGHLSNAIVVPSGFTYPTPTGYAPRGSFADGPYWTAGYAPWDQTIAPVTGLTFGGVVGGDCPDAREFAIQIFPVNADGNVGDPEPYVAGTVTHTVAAPNQILEATWVASPDAVKYYAVLFAFWQGMWRWQQAIETTGTTVQFDHAFDTPDPGTGLATGAVPVDSTFYYYDARGKSGAIVSQWHSVADPALWPEQLGISLILPNGKIRPIRLYYNGTGTDFQIKKRGAGPGNPMIFDGFAVQIEAGLNYWDDDFNDADAIVDTAAQTRLSGRVKGMYTRDVQLTDGNTWHEFLIAGVPISDCPTWYYDPGGDASNIEVNPAEGTDFLIPYAGNTGWSAVLGAARYRDVIGTDGVTRRYMMAYARNTRGDLLASGSATITFNVAGVEDQGDCEGNVITDAHDAFRHNLEQFIVASGEGYTSGPWLPAPTQGIENLPVVNAASFNEVRDMRADELSGGIVVAGITGFNGEVIDTSEEIKRWCRDLDARIGPNRKWEIVMRAINPNLNPLFVDSDLTDEWDIQKRTFKPQRKLAELQNVFTYRWARDTFTGGWATDNQSYRNQESIDAWTITKQGEDFNFNYVEDPSCVAHIFQKHVRRRANAPQYVTLEVDLCKFGDTFDLGQYFKIQHWRGPAFGGWVESSNRIMWILSSTFVAASKRLALECLDVTDLIGSTDALLLEGLMDIDLGGQRDQGVFVTTSLETVNAKEYRDRMFQWASFPDGTTLQARLYGTVPSGASMWMELYDPDTLAVVATDPDPITSYADFTLHTFQVPVSSSNKTYRLRATVSGAALNFVGFFGSLRPSLP